MARKTATDRQIFVAQLALALLVGLVGAGFAMYGFSSEVRERAWQNLVERPSGPMAFRFILQPVMATIAAVIDGIRDARTGSAPYLATILTDPANRVANLREGVISTARIIILGVGMDLIYQYIAFGTFFPGEAAFVAILLAFVPYLLLRGPFARLARSWKGIKPDDRAGR